MQLCVLAGHSPSPVPDDEDESAAGSVSVCAVDASELSDPSPVEPVCGVVVTGGGAVVENVANVVGPDPVVVLEPVLAPGAASPLEQARPKQAQTVAHRKRIIGLQDTSFLGRGPPIGRVNRIHKDPKSSLVGGETAAGAGDGPPWADIL